jgi:hypothetical protein
MTQVQFALRHQTALVTGGGEGEDAPLRWHWGEWGFYVCVEW